MIRKAQVLIATGFGSGYSPWAPGTCGTVVGAVLCIPLARLQPWLYTATVVGFIAIAIWCAAAADEHFDSHDDKRIVIDEIVGYFAALAWVPYSWKTALAAFVLFRFFDIAKPPPVSTLEKKLPGGYGVVLDDVMAGLYTNAVLQVLVYFIPWFRLH